MDSRERIKYVVGIGVLFMTGLMGGNIIWTSIEIALFYSILEFFEGGGRPPRGTKQKRLLCLDFF